jgi:hypothetical protein
MASYFRSTLQEFLISPPSEMLARLTLGYAADGFAEMRTELPLTWWDDLDSLRQALADLVKLRPTAKQWGLLLEFTIPRKEKRLDVVLLADTGVIVLECKTGKASADAMRQVEEYGLLLHYFHKASDRQRIFPVVVARSDVGMSRLIQQSDALRQHELGFATLPSFWIAATQVTAWSSLTTLLMSMTSGGPAIMESPTWDEAAYCPTPTIIEAAVALKTGLTVREIAQSEAAEHDISAVTDEIQEIVERAQSEGQHVLCFLTGVPGSGKTLVGLSLAHLSESRSNAIHFMSGNGPLVMVLQEVFRRQAMRDGVPTAQALIQAKTLIENVHVFAKNYTERDPDRAPSNHVIIFDEAQRAWNLAQNLSKFKRNYSEPEMLLRIMERHTDWACVIALVGGGQEINSGEAGLEEWGKAIAGSSTPWKVFASPEVIEGGTSTAGHRLFGEGTTPGEVNSREMLHLRTSNRSLRADRLAIWVNRVLEGDEQGAASMQIAERFPLFLSRDLSMTRDKLKHEALGNSRYGLVGSSGADRLRAEGLEPSSTFHAEYPWHHWYLAPREDVRSSFATEVFATEFEIQGLELDWVGVCWGGDYVWSADGWISRDLRHGSVSKWGQVKRVERQQFRRNAYRVLLTRARQGMVIYVPRGDANDPTRLPDELQKTAEYLLLCGVKPLSRPQVSMEN